MARFYCSEQRQLVPLVPINPGAVRMYVCGPTVYDASHVGHARPAVVFDTIRRYLEWSGYRVTYLSNITDVDDKIINRANQLRISWAALASRYQDEYERAMTQLGVRSPSIRPRATEYIPEMVDLIAALMDKKFAYLTVRGVWFDVSKCPDYGHLSGRRADDENTEHRVEEDSDKRNPQDFALWKLAKPGEPKWASPWGDGRPGWHTECCAMAGKHFDWELDIHAGGMDLQFPHHENEIVQAEAFSGRRFTHIWLHNNFVTVAKTDQDEMKMGKSKGNSFGLSDLFARYDPAAIRLWILSSHYRNPLRFQEDVFSGTATALGRIYDAIEMLQEGTRRTDASSPTGQDAASASPMAEAVRKMEDEFRQAMDNDANTALALAALHSFINDINRLAAEGLVQTSSVVGLSAMYTILSVLGLPPQRPQRSRQDVDDFIRLLIEVRKKARERKDFTTSDMIREGLTALGVQVGDKAGETNWER